MRVLHDTRSGWDESERVMRYAYASVFDDRGQLVCTIKDYGKCWVVIPSSWPLPDTGFRGDTTQLLWTYYPTFEAAYEALVAKLVAEKLETA